MSIVKDIKLSDFKEVLKAFSSGKPVIIVDDADRENEGDLAVASSKVNAENINFMLQHGRGLVCVTLTSERAGQLGIPLQVLNNNSPFNTQFAVTVDWQGVRDNGVTAAGRARTIMHMLDPRAAPGDFISPGSVVPLIAHPSGVLGRQGQTEGATDLARLAGLPASGVICEILNPDGSMMRGKALAEYAYKHELPVTSVAEIIKYRIQHEVFVRDVAVSNLSTKFGVFQVHVFEDDVARKEHLALIYGVPPIDSAVLVRLHSECLTGDVFGSRRCDCGPQLEMALEAIVKNGSGILLYLRQEGRGIGLSNKLKAYKLQDQGHDTVDANIVLGFLPDQRDFVVAARMLQSLGIEEINLLTNNPRKVKELEQSGIKVEKRVPLRVKPTPDSAAYLRTKRDKLGHIL
ncbi:MAG: GTP cyclohydrolase II [Candidatus Dadabacteria bacterium]|nr:MAG: GTP cyclohydrolase II [Candidatus Dadabacteria bacterium]